MTCSGSLLKMEIPEPFTTECLSILWISPQNLHIFNTNPYDSNAVRSGTTLCKNYCNFFFFCWSDFTLRDPNNVAKNRKYFKHYFIQITIVLKILTTKNKVNCLIPKVFQMLNMFNWCQLITWTKTNIWLCFLKNRFIKLLYCRQLYKGHTFLSYFQLNSSIFNTRYFYLV